jgi:hypothetical protein
MSLSFEWCLAASDSPRSQTVTAMVGAETNTPGGGVFQFIPNQITAANGTTITFKFTGMYGSCCFCSTPVLIALRCSPGNHSITQSTFANPCTGAPGGFDSGWVELLKNTTDGTGLPEWNLTITNDQTRASVVFLSRLLLTLEIYSDLVLLQTTAAPAALLVWCATSVIHIGPTPDFFG